MESKMLFIVMDILVLLALGATMYFLRHVSGSIRVIREGRTELQQLLQQMNIHISNAQHAIESMNKLADEKGKQIQKNIETANGAIDELQFIQRAADNVAQRLEKLTGQGGAVAAQAAAVSAEQPAGGGAGAKPASRTMSKAEKELADAIAARRAKGE